LGADGIGRHWSNSSWGRREEIGFRLVPCPESNQRKTQLSKRSRVTSTVMAQLDGRKFKIDCHNRPTPSRYRLESFTVPMLTAEAADLAGCTCEVAVRAHAHSYWSVRLGPISSELLNRSDVRRQIDQVSKLLISGCGFNESLLKLAASCPSRVLVAPRRCKCVGSFCQGSCCCLQ
jgi:hypothetical protein